MQRTNKTTPFIRLPFLVAILLYQLLISPLLKAMVGQPKFCRYTPTCSQYAAIVIKKYGIIKGSYLAVCRILTCQPFFKQKVTPKIRNTKQ